MTANSAISVISAYYGYGSTTDSYDVAASVQSIFDGQYDYPNGNTTDFFVGPIGYALFGLSAPSGSGQLGAFTIAYSLTAVEDNAEGTQIFVKGGQDGDTVNIVASPATSVTVLSAVYGNDTQGIDVTSNLNIYLNDPSNSTSLTIGSAAFLNALTNGVIPPSIATMYFSVVYNLNNSSLPSIVCGSYEQIVSLT